MSSDDAGKSRRDKYEAEILSHLAEDEISIWRNGAPVMNPLHFRADKDELDDDKAKAASLLARIYTAQPDSQADLAKELATGQDRVAVYMWYEAIYSGHITVKKAIEESGEVALLNADVSQQWKDSSHKYQKDRSNQVLEASADEKASTAQEWLDEFPSEQSQLLFEAAVKGDDLLISYLLSKGVELHPERLPHIVPLHAACFQGNLACAKLLHNAGIDVDHMDEFGGTPIMRAAIGGNEDVVRWLLDNGANALLRETREGNYGALEYCAGKSYAIAKMLVDAGCGFSFDALAAAASFGNEKSFDLLFAKGDLSKPPVEDRLNSEELDARRLGLLKALSMSGVGGSTHIIKSLMDARVEVSDRQEPSNDAAELKDSLQNAAYGAAEQCNPEALDLLISLLRKHLSDGSSSEFVTSLLTGSAGAGSTSCVRLLIETHGANVNDLRKPDMTSPLHHAVRGGDTGMVRMLIEDYEAEIHKGRGKYANGPTPLWHAIVQQDEPVVRTLLELGNGGPVEDVDLSIRAETTRVYVSASRDYRARVVILSQMDPEWNEQNSSERFLCLEYPDGCGFKPRLRKPDWELKDERELRPLPHEQVRPQPPQPPTESLWGGLSRIFGNWGWSRE